MIRHLRQTSSRRQRSLVVEPLESRALLASVSLDLFDSFDDSDIRYDESVHVATGLSAQQRSQLIEDFLREQTQLQPLEYSYPILQRGELADNVWIEPITTQTSLVFRVDASPRSSIVVLGLLRSDDAADDSSGDGPIRTISSPGSDALPAVSEPVLETELPSQRGISNPSGRAESPGDALGNPGDTDGPEAQVPGFRANPTQVSFLRDNASDLDIAIPEIAESGIGISTNDRLHSTDGQSRALQIGEQDELELRADDPLQFFERDVANSVYDLTEPSASDRSERANWSVPVHDLSGLDAWIHDPSRDAARWVAIAAEEMTHLNFGSRDLAFAQSPLLGGLGQIGLSAHSDASSDINIGDSRDGEPWEVINSVASNPELASAVGLLTLMTGMSVIGRQRQRDAGLEQALDERSRRERRDD